MAGGITVATGPAKAAVESSQNSSVAAENIHRSPFAIFNM